MTAPRGIIPAVGGLPDVRLSINDKVSSEEAARAVGDRATLSLTGRPGGRGGDRGEQQRRRASIRRTPRLRGFRASGSGKRKEEVSLVDIKLAKNAPIEFLSRRSGRMDG